jgi:hypothetical protein
MSNVINIKPASHTEKYDGFTITITFDPPTGKWAWIAVKRVQTEIKYEGVAKGKGDAAGAAKRKIDGR